jgi:hypothetical protein
MGRHRAGGDARATAQVLLGLLADARRQEVDSWDQLQTLLKTPKSPTKWSYLPRSVSVEAVA